MPKPRSDSIIRFWAIIGDGGTGKSSIIRALTGVGNISRVGGGVSERWRVAYVPGEAQQTFVQGCSLQEVELQPLDFVSRVSATNSKLIIVALQPNSSVHRARRFPDAQTYFDEFVSAGWNLGGYATLGNVQALQGFPPPVALTDSATSPANREASVLRQMWGIL